MKFFSFSVLLTIPRTLLICFCLVQAAVAVEPFQVQDIRMEGLQRVEPGNILATLPFKWGTTTPMTREHLPFAIFLL